MEEEMIDAVDELTYLSELIKDLDLSTGEKRQYTKGLLLTSSGITPNGIVINQIHLYDSVLSDWVTNFKQLYPHLFDAINPAFIWVVGVIKQESFSYNSKG